MYKPNIRRPSSPFDSYYLEKGGPGSGHFSHDGRPGKVGGSLPADTGGGSESNRTTIDNKTGINLNAKQLKEISDKVFSRLTPEEIGAIEHYSDNGFFMLNRFLRGQANVSEEMKKRVARIESAINKAGEFDHPVTTYRVIALERIDQEEMFKIGKTIRMKGFQSTSSDKDFPHKYGSGNILMEITTKRGLPIGDRSKHPKEREILLGHNWKYKVIGIGRGEFGGTTRKILKLRVL